MALNVNFDVNKGLENPRSRKFIVLILSTIVIVGILTYSATFILGSKGAHIKVPGVEIGDKPKDSTNTIIIDNSTKIDVKGDYINGDKVINQQRDSSKSKETKK